MFRNTANAWGAPAKLLHWTIAALVFAQIALGWMAVSWRLSPAKLDLFVWHKSTGMLILVLMAARIVWRLGNPVPALPKAMAPLERGAARLTHVLLYVLLVATPVTGWIVASASNIPFRMYWLIPVPSIVAPDKATEGFAARVHFSLFIVSSVLLLAHVGAAVRHHFVKRDGVLIRMLPGTGGTAR
jgi:cytochrome b561